MTTRPTSSPAFATDATFTSGAETGLVPRLDPGSGFKQQGWYPNRRMPARWFNWLVGIIGDWLLYLTEKTDGIFSPLNFDAIGDGAADDLAELQACFDAAKAAVTAGGGNVTIDLGGKTYRITGMLQDIHPTINVKNGQILLDHASNHTLEFSVATPTGDGIHIAGVWECVNVDVMQANSGILVYNDSAVCQVVFRNCHFNESGFCTGRLCYTPPASDLTFENCFAKIPVNNPGFLSNAGVLTLTGGKYTTPNGYADYVVGGTGGVHNVQGVTFDTNLSGSGTVECIHMSGAQLRAVDNTFDDGGGNGNTAIGLANNGIVWASGNRFKAINPYKKTASLPLARGSYVELLPYLESSIADATWDEADWYYESIAIVSSHSAPPTATLIAPQYRGQRKQISIMNNHATDDWVGTPAFEPAADLYLSTSGLTGIANKEVGTLHFVAQELATDLFWVQVGPAEIVA